jgi:gas vesicle protein
LLTGLAAGTLIGVLLAPEKGSDTRDKLVRKGRDLYDRFREGQEEKSTATNGVAVPLLRAARERKLYSGA